jgi:hypothetical protein
VVSRDLVSSSCCALYALFLFAGVHQLVMAAQTCSACARSWYIVTWAGVQPVVAIIGESLAFFML